MSLPKPTAWFDSTQLDDFRPPVFVPDAPAPPWVRNAIGSRQITPSASLLSGGECLNESEPAENNNKQVSTCRYKMFTFRAFDSVNFANFVRPVKSRIKFP